MKKGDLVTGKSSRQDADYCTCCHRLALLGGLADSPEIPFQNTSTPNNDLLRGFCQLLRFDLDSYFSTS